MNWLYWRDGEGAPYRGFSRLADAVNERDRELVFALNAGMYQADFSPVGLYVQDGAELRPVNTAQMDGARAQVPNFFKAPNGVFFIGDSGAGILPTPDFVAADPAVRLATQSGPMLVIDGALRPALIEGSRDRTRRSGVGVCTDGTIRFAISRGNVNFHDFARLFRDHLGCRDALFLDGGRGTGLYLPAMGRNDTSWHGGYGPMFGLVR